MRKLVVKVQVDDCPEYAAGMTIIEPAQGGDIDRVCDLLGKRVAHALKRLVAGKLPTPPYQVNEPCSKVTV